MKRLALANKTLLILILFLLVLILLRPVDLLEARDFDNQSHLGYFRPKDKIFTIKYTHSVMLSPVTETYRMEEGGPVLLESTFKDYGAGLPSDTPYDFEIDPEEKLFRIYNINKKISPLVYRTGDVRANHRLIFNGRELPFKSFSRGKEAVEFRQVRKSYLRYLLD